MNYIGIDIGGTNLKAGLVDEDGRLLAVKTMKIREVSDPDALTDTLVALTRELARRAGKVVSVELDRRLWPVLEETMAGCENFTLVQGDVMQQDLAALAREHFGGLRPILCANLPYNITTPLLTRVVESR